MVTKLVVEGIVYALLYSALMLLLFKTQGAKYQLYNYPPAIKERAIQRGITTQAELDSHAKKNKIIGLIGMIVLCIIITCCVNKEYSFGAGFLEAYIFLNAFSLFDALVIDSIWFCHGKWWVIPGTEDMKEAYHDYAFHWKWFFLCLVSSIPLAAIIGGIEVLIGKIF